MQTATQRFNHFTTGLPQEIHKPLSCVKQPKHLHLIIQTPSETAVHFITVLLDIYVLFSTKMVTGSSDTGDCFSTKKHFSAALSHFTAVNVTTVEW